VCVCVCVCARARARSPRNNLKTCAADRSVRSFASRASVFALAYSQRLCCAVVHSALTPRVKVNGGSEVGVGVNGAVGEIAATRLPGAGGSSQVANLSNFSAPLRPSTIIISLKPCVGTSPGFETSSDILVNQIHFLVLREGVRQNLAIGS
jgi:hypothetical protein